MSGPAENLRNVVRVAAWGEGAITGTVVCAAVIAYAGSGPLESTWRLCLAIAGTVLVYWVAHLHAATLGDALTRRNHPLQALRHALVATTAIPASAALPIGVLVVLDRAGVALEDAVWVALFFTIAMLVLYSYLAGVRGGLGTRGRITSALVGAGIGLLAAGLKIALH